MYKLIVGLLILFAALSMACGDDESTPAALGEPTDESTATASAAGGDAAGGTFSSSQLPMSVTVTTPDGWEQPSEADLPDLFAAVQAEFPNGYIDFLQPTQIYNRPTATESELTGPPADYVAWFNENPFLRVVAKEDVTVGNLQGTRLEITNREEADTALFKLSNGSDYNLIFSHHIYGYVLDVNGTQIIVTCGPRNPRNFGVFRKTCDEVLTTVEFGT